MLLCWLAVMLAALCALPQAALAQDWREALLAGETKPLALSSLQEQQPFTPFPCTPDQLVAVLLGQATVDTLSLVFDGMGIQLRAEDITFSFPEGGRGAFLREGLSIARRAFANVLVGGDIRDVQTVTLGHDSFNFTFIFLTNEMGIWTLHDALPCFDRTATQSGGENTWLVGKARTVDANEDIAYERWYNLATHAVEVSMVTHAAKVIDDDGDASERLIAYVSTHPRVRTSSREDAQGMVRPHLVLQASRYVSICRLYGEEKAQIQEMDAYACMDIFEYNPDTYALETRGAWAYDNISPAVLEYALQEWFMDDVIQGR